MVKHIVCFKLKAGEDKNKAKEVLFSMKGNVPLLRGIKVNIDELQSPRSYDVILETLFEDFDALDSYQKDAYHCGVVKTHMNAVCESSITMDYQVSENDF